MVPKPFSSICAIFHTISDRSISTFISLESISMCRPLWDVSWKPVSPEQNLENLFWVYSVKASSPYTTNLYSRPHSSFAFFVIKKQTTPKVHFILWHVYYIVAAIKFSNETKQIRRVEFEYSNTYCYYEVRQGLLEAIRSNKRRTSLWM